jgi:hypothetical protein
MMEDGGDEAVRGVDRAVGKARLEAFGKGSMNQLYISP